MIRLVKTYLIHTIEAKETTKCVAIKDYQLIYWWRRTICLGTEDQLGVVRKSNTHPND